MNRVRSAINNFMNNERYSRFTLQPEVDGERRVEVKLSEDGFDGDGEANPGGSPTFRPAPRGLTRRNICCLLLGTLLIFIVGYMVAYLTHRKPKVSPCENSTVYRVVYKDKVVSVMPEEPEPSLSWSDITKLLNSKLTPNAFTDTLSNIDEVTPRPASSPQDTRLGNTIFEQFKKLKMEPWTDVHSVRLQTPDKEKPNTVTFGSNVFRPQGYLAYSGTGKSQGKLVYANYGRPEDFAVLKRYDVAVNGSVVMMRTGKISFAEKVANAEGKGATAVLLHPDNQDFIDDTEVFGHVHFGSGDPYTPGFPSFNQTQFPPTKSSGLPTIPAQTITAGMAKTILQTIGGPVPEANTGFGRSLGGIEDITVEVNNVLVFREIHNVFGVIKGFIDPDRYVVIGAHRDAWGQGYARSTVGTSALIELAKAVYEMVKKDGFRPRRSIVFASWSAGEYGVGATEWLEGYLSSITRNVVSYISLDGIVQGQGSFYASASPLLQTLLENTLKTIKNPTGTGFVSNIASPLRPMSIDDPAYPFLAASGIPSISFHFIAPNNEEYVYYNTLLDNKDHLNYKTNQKTSSVLASAAQIAGQMALRLVHDHMIKFDVTRYKRLITSNVSKVNKHLKEIQKSEKLRDVSTQWLSSAKGSFDRAAEGISNDMVNTDMTDPEACRLLNDRLMRIEHSLLSPYVSPLETPFRHMLFGQGPHTFAAIADTEDEAQLHTQLALATWNLQSCADAMVANIWDLDNEI